jgi:subtilisin family serine protease
MAQYVVLRDLSRPDTSGPFAGTVRPGPTVTIDPDAPAEPRVDVEDLAKHEVLEVAREPEVQAVARVMPTMLIRPVPSDEAGEGADGTATAGEDAWGIAAVGADVSGRTGTGVTVAVLDTGIDAVHPAFTGVDVVEEDFSGSGNGDANGHGTHCAGTILGRDVDDTRIGVARGVGTVLAGKVLSDTGGGDSEMIFRGIQWAVQRNAQVISMSLGFDFAGLVKSLVEEEGWPVDLATSVALEAYRANLRMFDSLMGMIRNRDAFGVGTVVVAAAGNESKRTIKPDYEIGASLPAAAEGVISVGALGRSPQGLVIAPFSNTFPQISAPGVGVLSAKTGGGLHELNGTSMAAPHVAGAAALWWEEVVDSALPPTSAVVTSKVLASATTEGIAASVDPSDRGTGITRCP